MKRVVFFSIFTSWFFVLFSQENFVSGKVLVFDSIPLVNVDVEILSSRENVKTDSVGRFKCLCTEKDKLVLSASGFNKKTIRVRKRKGNYYLVSLDLSKVENAENIVIDSGYVDFTKIATFQDLLKKHNNEIDYSKYKNVMEILQSEFSGLQFSNGQVIIRGKSSVNSSSAAAIELNGVITDASVLTSLPTYSIKKIKIIKGADSAIYGVRGGNGVVSITTK